MPYGLPNETPSQTAKMERCVAARMADSNFKPYKGRTKKQSSIAICKAAVTGTTKRKK